jgi:transcription elongation factor Elf1
MDVVLDQQVECLCCGKMVYINSREWKMVEAPVALCQGCAQSTPKALVRVLYLMRSQIRSLYADQQLMQKDIKRLFTAQQEMEQELLGSA